MHSNPVGQSGRGYLLNNKHQTVGNCRCGRRVAATAAAMAAATAAATAAAAAAGAQAALSTLLIDRPMQQAERFFQWSKSEDGESGSGSGCTKRNNTSTRSHRSAGLS